jgi:hypothetical protein
MSENNTPNNILNNTRFMNIHNFLHYFNNYCIYNNNTNKVYHIYNNERIANVVRNILVRDNVVKKGDIAIIKVCKYMNEDKQKDVCMKKALELFNN